MSEVKKLAEQAKRYGSLTVTLDADDVLALQQQLDALAVENTLLDSAIGAIADAHATGVADLLAQEIDTAVNAETPATDAALNAIRAEGIIMFASKQLSAAGDLDSTITLERLMLDAEKFAGQLRAGKDGE